MINFPISHWHDTTSQKKKKLSRTRIQNFLNCMRCFYLEEIYGLSRVSMPPFLINSTVDSLLKKEFDLYREEQQPHPYFELCSLNAIPAQHPELNTWRNVFSGVKYMMDDVLIFGGIDDLWINSDNEYIVADYKATAKKDTPTIEGKYGKIYKNQIEFYQWLLRKNELKVSNDAYFVYCNGKKNLDRFDNKVEFDVHMIKHVGSDDWVEQTIKDAIDCLKSEEVPSASTECEHCNYVKNRHNIGKSIKDQS